MSAMGFCSGGIQEGSLSEASQPPRPPGIPAHYIFDRDVELWMPPSAIEKAAAVKGVGTTTAGGIEIITSFVAPEGKPSDPICFEFTNTGKCGRLNRGESCRYRHLPPTHPHVLADRVRLGKLPPTALELAVAAATGRALPPDAASAAGVAQVLLPGQTEMDLPDPGPSASLCFDYINNGSCSRLRAAQMCKYRHLPPTHPDVIADRVRHGKLTPLQAQAMLAGSSSAAGGASNGFGAAPGTAPGGASNGLGAASAAAGAAAAPGTAPSAAAAACSLAIPPAIPPSCWGGASMCAPTDPIAAAALMNMTARTQPSLPADPGQGASMCFDFINRGMCSRLQRGEQCKYRHLPPHHPDVIADKVKQGKLPPSALSNPGLAFAGAAAGGLMGAMSGAMGLGGMHAGPNLASTMWRPNLMPPGFPMGMNGMPMMPMGMNGLPMGVNGLPMIPPGFPPTAGMPLMASPAPMVPGLPPGMLPLDSRREGREEREGRGRDEGERSERRDERERSEGRYDDRRRRDERSDRDRDRERDRDRDLDREREREHDRRDGHHRGHPRSRRDDDEYERRGGDDYERDRRRYD